MRITENGERMEEEGGPGRKRRESTPCTIYGYQLKATHNLPGGILFIDI